MTKPDIILSESEKAFLYEQKRAETLTERADKFIGAIVILVGFQLTQSPELSLNGGGPRSLSIWLMLGAFVLLGLALVLAALSMNVRFYYSYPRGGRLIEELKDDEIDEEVAKVKLARMYLNAQDLNGTVNDSRGRLLAWSGILIVIGFSIYVISYLVSRISSP